MLIVRNDTYLPSTPVAQDGASSGYLLNGDFAVLQGEGSIPSPCGQSEVEARPPAHEPCGPTHTLRAHDSGRTIDVAIQTSPPTDLGHQDTVASPICVETQQDLDVDMGRNVSLGSGAVGVS
jgi:hypothetical protein